MSNPVVTKMKEGNVECVARSVTTGTINRSNKNKDSMKFLCTYRMTGEDKPSYAQMLIEGIELFKISDQAEIGNSDEIDVHMSCINGSESDEWGEVIIWT